MKHFSAVLIIEFSSKINVGERDFFEKAKIRIIFMKKAKAQNKPVIDDHVELNDLLTIYWNYYEFHADQRLRILNYFITIEIVLFGAFFTTLQIFAQNQEIYWPCYMVAGAISIIALISFLLDVRTTNLIHFCRIALRTFEQKYTSSLPREMQLFSYIKSSKVCISFSFLVRICYGFIIACGFVLMVMIYTGTVFFK